MNDSQIRTDDCRHEVLNALYARRRGAHEAETIKTVFLSRSNYTLEEVQTALMDLERLHYAERADSGMTGSVTVWQITGDGLKFKEKGTR